MSAKNSSSSGRINFIKENNCCQLCGESDISCLDFHHINPSDKKFSITDGRNYGIREVLDEISKCAILCSNCHRKLHHKKINTDLYPVIIPKILYNTRIRIPYNKKIIIKNIPILESIRPSIVINIDNQYIRQAIFYIT